MPLLPVRQVGEHGIITDVNPHELPLNAWNDGRNISFTAGRMHHAPVFKKTGYAWSLPNNPAYALNVSLDGVGADVLVIGDEGTFTQFSNGNILTDIAPTPAWNPSSSTISATSLGGVIYLNSPNEVPLMRARQDTTSQFERLTKWPSDTRATILRAYKDYLIALNVTKEGTEYPNMIKWSDAMQAGVEPSWSTTAENSLAGENVLNDATSHLLDGIALGNSMVLYSGSETYRMDYVGEPFVFSFDKVFSDLGTISADCVTEVDGKHFVFGTNDIVVHDGITKQSIADNRVRRAIFTRLDFASSDRCFVVHNAIRSEVMFCYPSKSDASSFILSGANTGCNEAAVYNYRDNTWTFIDLPYVSAFARAAIPFNGSDVSLTWSSVLQWDAEAIQDTTWYSAEGAYPTMLGFFNAKSTSYSLEPKLSFYDSATAGYLSNDVDPDFQTMSWAETALRSGDNFQASLSSMKLCRAVYPQIMTPRDTEITVSTGASLNLPNGTLWAKAQTFNPFSQIKCDFRTTGRYLSLKFEFPVGSWAELTGYDYDFEVLAQR